MNNYFSTNLKYLRKKQGLTQEHLADIVNKKKSIVGNYEKGNVEPSMETIQKISDYFTVNWISLLGTDFSIALVDDTKGIDNNHTTTATTIIELVTLRKDNAQKDKRIEKLEAQVQTMSEQIKALKQNQTK